MFDPEALERMAARRRAWEAEELKAFLERQPESRPAYRTGSGLPVQRVYTGVPSWPGGRGRSVSGSQTWV